MEEETLGSRNPRQLIGFTSLIALTWGLFQIWSGFSGGLTDFLQRGIHVGFGLLMASILYPIIARGREAKTWRQRGLALVVGGISGTLLVAIIVEVAKRYLHAPLPTVPGFVWAIIGLIITAALYPWTKYMVRHNLRAPADILLVSLAVVATVCAIAQFERVMMLISFMNTLDYLVVISLLFVILELGRRAIGFSMPLLIVLLLLYTLFGQYIPGLFGHPQITVQTLLHGLFLIAPTSLYGTIVGISAVVVAILIIFGGVLLVTGGGAQFIDIALLLVGRTRGGPAKVAVVSSSLFGMISGSTVANAAVCGNFTIPMMKKVGYETTFAAGVEATASTGGQIMPPIMGVAAFIMAELLQISYLSVVVAAILPALAYYGACFVSVDFYSARRGLHAVDPEQIPTARAVLSKWRSLTPLILSLVVIIFLLIKGYSIAYVIFWALIGIMIIYLLLGGKLSLFWKRGLDLIGGVESGARGLVTLAIITAVAQVLVSLIGISGLGTKVTMVITSVGQGNFFIALLCAAIAPLILGMGVPTVAAYVICIGLVAPPLIVLGLKPLVAHMFVFYYAVLASITPPLCAAVFVTAAIASCSWFRASLWALRLGFAGLIVPMIFAYRPGLLLIGTPQEVFLAILVTALAIIAWAAAFIGFLSRPLKIIERVALFVGGILLIVPGMVLDIAGGIIVVGTYIWQRSSISSKMSKLIGKGGLS